MTTTRWAMAIGAVLLALAPSDLRGGGPNKFGRPCSGCEDVSLIQLIANPADFESHSVLVQGFLYVDDHGDYICLSTESARYFIAKNCLSLKFDTEALGASEEELREFDLGYAMLAGTFRQAEKGHASWAAGGLSAVRYFVGERADRPDSGRSESGSETSGRGEQ